MGSNAVGRQAWRNTKVRRGVLPEVGRASLFNWRRAGSFLGSARILLDPKKASRTFIAVLAKHPNMALLHVGTAKGTERVATCWRRPGKSRNELRQLIADAGMAAVIPSTRSRKVPIPHDATIYKARDCIERCLNKLKRFRRFATRFDRRASRFMLFIHLASAMIWMRSRPRRGPA